MPSRLADTLERTVQEIRWASMTCSIRKTKSDLGRAFIGLIDGGRLTEFADDTGWAGSRTSITRIYRHQLAACTYEVLPGPGKLLP